MQAIRGMNDVLPDEATQWEQLEDTLRDWLSTYGYQPIRMPLVEQTALPAACAPRFSTICCMTGRSGSGTRGRCSATKGRRRVARASFTRSA